MAKAEKPQLNITKEQVMITGGGLLVSGIVDLATHFDKGFVFWGFAGAILLGKGAGDALAAYMIPGRNAKQMLEATGRFVDAALPAGPQEEDQTALAKIKRLAGMKTPPVVKAPQKQNGHPAQRPPVSSVEEVKPPIPGQFRLGDKTLAAIKDINSNRYVYFGKTATRDVVIHIDEMYHVLDVAKSGRGKSNRFRHAMMQMVELADTYYLNPFAAPVKSVTDKRQIEVWQPIYDRLANGRPIRESDEILQALTRLVQAIEMRSEQEQVRDFSWRKRPIFVFIDEIPEIYARCPDAVKLLDRIGRGGRQFGIFAWIATQSALVSDIGLSTASQAQFKTLLYGGGDKTSGNRVMGSVSAEQEKALKSNGAGLVLMIADGVDDSEYVRAPLVTNEALFAYFGLPDFKMEDWLIPAKSVSRLPGLPTKSNLLPLPLYPDANSQAQKSPETTVSQGKGERGKRVKGPNCDAILDAMDTLEEEGKSLTLHAIAKRAGLTRHQYEEIEDVAIEYGYDLDRGKGRPAKEG